MSSKYKDYGKQPEGTIPWYETYYVREVHESLEDILGIKLASGMDNGACKYTENLNDYCKGMLREIEDITCMLEEVEQFIASEIPESKLYYVDDAWEEKPE